MKRSMCGETAKIWIKKKKASPLEILINRQMTEVCYFWLEPERKDERLQRQ